jgi:hypothetical protein
LGREGNAGAGQQRWATSLIHPSSIQVWSCETAAERVKAGADELGGELYGAFDDSPSTEKVVLYINQHPVDLEALAGCRRCDLPRWLLRPRHGRPAVLL